MRKIILFFEDEELDVIRVESSLKKHDIENKLYTSFNGKKALSILNDSKSPVMPDVILLDLNMPKMNGIEFLKSIRADKRFENTKVFVMTTSAETNDRVLTEQLGISGYIIKPLSYNDNTKKADSMDSFVQFHLRK